MRFRDDLELRRRVAEEAARAGGAVRVTGPAEAGAPGRTFVRRSATPAIRPGASDDASSVATTVTRGQRPAWCPGRDSRGARRCS